MLSIIIQIILGLFLILIMALLAYSIYDREYLKSISILNTNKKETTIFKGVFPFSKEEVMIETLNRNDPYYVDLNPSVNQNGGAEYSYNFWVYFNIKDKTNNLILDNTDKKYIVLFYKGARQLIPYKQYNYACDTFDRTSGVKMQSQPYILVKNPLVKISNDGKQIIVEYNNLNTPDTFNSSASPIVCSTLQDIYGNNGSDNPENVKNKLGVKQIDTDKYNKTYNMVTIVMQETPSNEDVLFQNRTNCKVYFNGSLISDRSTYNNDLLNTLSTDSLSTAMKSNMGNLYINPYKTFYDSTTPIDKSPPDTYHTQSDYSKATVNEITETDGITKDVPLKMANLTYYNYALSVDEIYKLYNKGYSNDLADILTRNNPDVNKNINKGAKINFDVYSSDGTNKLPVQSI